MASGKASGKGKDKCECNKSDHSQYETYKGKSHNKRRKCLFCDYIGVHLARHLTVAHLESAQTNAERARVVYKADENLRQKQGQKTTLTNPEELLYQCGLPDCHAIVSRMSQHLKRAHKLKHPGELSGKRPSDEDPKPSKMAKKNTLLQTKLIVKTSTKGKKKLSSSKDSSRKKKRVVQSDSSSKDSAQVEYDDDSDASLPESGDDYDKEEVPRQRAV